jgi:hypothetical protein
LALRVEAVLLHAGGKTDEAIAVWQGVVAAHGRSSDPEIRRVAAAAQHSVANGFMCLGRSAGADEAMDELVARFGEVAVEALQKESVRHAELLGRPLNAVEAGAVALSTARIFARCAPTRVASVTDPAVVELRAAAPSPTHDVLIAQLEQLRADAPAS